jgi:ribosomal protein S27AE
MSFWAQKLGMTAPSSTPAPPPSRQLYPMYNGPASPQMPAPTPQQDYTPSVRLKQGSICPGCGSDKYIGQHGSYAIACGECGYHPRFEQSGYGERSLASQPGEVQAARQNTNRSTMAESIQLLNAGGGDHI